MSHSFGHDINSIVSLGVREGSTGRLWVCWDVQMGNIIQKSTRFYVTVSGYFRRLKNRMNEIYRINHTEYKDPVLATWEILSTGQW